MDAFENMNKKTKIILSIIGISAVVVPAVLLMLVSQNTQVPPQADNAPRQIDQINVGEQKNVIPTPPPATSGQESTPISR